MGKRRKPSSHQFSGPPIDNRLFFPQFTLHSDCCCLKPNIILPIRCAVTLFSADTSCGPSLDSLEIDYIGIPLRSFDPVVTVEFYFVESNLGKWNSRENCAISCCPTSNWPTLIAAEQWRLYDRMLRS